jgi:hypothetical protein
MLTFMSRKKSTEPVAPKPNDGWTVSIDIQIHGRYVSKGTELKISGERGRFRFIKHVITDKASEWIDVWGGPKGCESIRSFTMDRVKTVHSKNKTDVNLLKASKEGKKKEKLANQNEQQ